MKTALTVVTAIIMPGGFIVLAVAIVAAFAVFFGQASAATLLADNPGQLSLPVVSALNTHLFAVDACNGSNLYGEGHDCAFKSADGTAEGSE